MGWNKLHKFIYTKKSLTGLAILFIHAEKGINTYDKLKKTLRKKYDIKTSAAEIHKILFKRQKKREESCQEYFLVMREIASRGDIDLKSLMQNVIDGIVDDSRTKLISYLVIFTRF